MVAPHSSLAGFVTPWAELPFTLGSVCETCSCACVRVCVCACVRVCVCACARVNDFVRSTLQRFYIFFSLNLAYELARVLPQLARALPLPAPQRLTPHPEKKKTYLTFRTMVEGRLMSMTLSSYDTSCTFIPSVIQSL